MQVFADILADLKDVVAEIGVPAGSHFEHDKAERVDIGPTIGVATFQELLRRFVDIERIRQVKLEAVGKATKRQHVDIGYDDFPGISEKDILGLEIFVQRDQVAHSRRGTDAVDLIESLHDALSDQSDQVGMQRGVFVDNRAEGVTLDESEFPH